MTEKEKMYTKNVIKICTPDNKGTSCFDDGIRSRVEMIFVSYGQHRLDALQFVYRGQDGISGLSDIHGCDNTDNFITIKLDETECITFTCVRGFRGYIDDGGATFVTSITFVTNKATYGPFGKLSDYYPFDYNFGENCLVAGFHGRLLSGRLEAIGVNIQPKMLAKSVAEDVKGITKPAADLNYYPFTPPNIMKTCYG